MAFQSDLDLERFVIAQNFNESFLNAISELVEGKKRSHWIWWIFPQLRGLGVSEQSIRFSIGSIAEATAYLTHPVLGPRLIMSTKAILSHAGTGIVEVLGTIDSQKFQSSMTLFALVGPTISLYSEALATFFDNNRCSLTIQLVGALEQRP